MTQHVLRPNIANRIFGGTEARVVIDCRRCGTLSPSKRMRRWRCRKCKSPVDSGQVIFRIIAYEQKDGRRRRLSQDEMEQAFDRLAEEHGVDHDGPCPYCEDDGAV